MKRGWRADGDPRVPCLEVRFGRVLHSGDGRGLRWVLAFACLDAEACSLDFRVRRVDVVVLGHRAGAGAHHLEGLDRYTYKELEHIPIRSASRGTPAAHQPARRYVECFLPPTLAVDA